MSPVRHRTEQRGESPGLVVLGGVLGALLIFVHSAGAVVPGLAAYYLYNEDGQPKLAAAVLGWAVLVIAARLYLTVSG